MEVAAAAAAFAVCIREMLPEKAVLSDVLLHMPGSTCAERMQACSKSVAGRGDLAISERCNVNAKHTHPCFFIITASLSWCAVYSNVCDAGNFLVNFNAPVSLLHVWKFVYAYMFDHHMQLNCRICCGFVPWLGCK